VNPDEILQRLREALRAAMKAKDTVAVSALRSALAAIANAEAIPVPAAGPVTSGNQPGGSQHVAGSAAGLGAAEARRRDLTGDDVAGVIAAEVAERRDAARQYESTGNSERAARLRREAEIIQSAAARPLVLVRGWNPTAREDPMADADHAGGSSRRPTEPQGRFAGMPYDWRRPTMERLRERCWNPDDDRLLTPRVWGWGYDLNWYWVTHPRSYLNK
jgi:uncharacterized protein YqeY